MSLASTDTIVSKTKSLDIGTMKNFILNVCQWQKEFSQNGTVDSRQDRHK